MNFISTPLKDAFVVELKKMQDSRGYFARQFCRKEFEAQGLIPDVVQVNTSFNEKKGTLRGMHMQKEPHGETKFIRCIRGAIYDVIIDLRPQSPSYKKWFGIRLDSSNGHMLYVPKEFAHGYLTLEDGSEVIYLVSAYYEPSSETGVRYDDPAFGIQWPEEIKDISDKDSKWARYTS